jgi:hypothetical protein
MVISVIFLGKMGQKAKSNFYAFVRDYLPTSMSSPIFGVAVLG